MVKAFFGILVVLGLGAGAFYMADPVTAKKTFDDNKAKVDTLVDSFNKK